MFRQQIDHREIYSVFQPIYSFSNQACIGAEALLRGIEVLNKKPLSALECLEKPAGLSNVEYNRTINEMHLKNWQQSGIDKNWIFVNLDFNSLKSIDDLCLQNVSQNLDLDGKEIVVEVVENEIEDEELFDQVVTKLRKMGCLIALDDFGAGSSNIDRIWKAQPEIVKLDRRVLLEATKSLRGESILRNLCVLIKQAGSITLLEGIETKEQAMLAMDVGVDLVQGFYFAKPNTDLSTAGGGEELIRGVVRDYPDYRHTKFIEKQSHHRGYSALFDNLKSAESAIHLEQIMHEKAQNTSIKRFFILDDKGYQISEEPNNDNQGQNNQRILKKGKGLCWKNRRYFYEAKQNADSIYVSQPYRSLIDVELCLTISKSIHLKSNEHVVACYDVFHEDST